MSVDNCIHSFFGVSKSYADLLLQEYGKNAGMKTVCFRAGCITGPNHSGAKLHGFLSYLVKASLQKKQYTLIGYKGKQVRDNIHSFDVATFISEFIDKPRVAAVYNIGGGDSVALLSVNPTGATNAVGDALTRINLSYADNDSTLNILSNGVVQTVTITMDNVNTANDGATDEAVLNLNEGGKNYIYFYPDVNTNVGVALNYVCDYKLTLDQLTGTHVQIGGFYYMDEMLTPVLAAADGIVTYTDDGNFDRWQFGDNSQNASSNVISIIHSGGYYTTYFSLKKNSILVAEGDTVQAGDTIGYPGSSHQLSQTPHLLFEVGNLTNNTLQHKNPVSYTHLTLPTKRIV